MPGEWLRPLMTKSGFMYDNPSEKRAYSRGRCGGVGLGILAALDNKKPKVIPILPARGKCGSGEENGGNLCSCKTADFDDSRPFTFKPANFLYSCYLCRRTLSQEKDIYMYRGDQAFCSEECRYQKIVSDERKERCLSSVSSFNVCSSSIFTITT